MTSELKIMADGRSVLTKNKTLSVRIGKKVRAKRSRCYENAWKVVERLYPSAAYVEGFAVSHGALILEHGWVGLDGEIIDRTLPELDMPYFPGLRFVGKTGLEKAQKTPGMLECGSYLPIFYRFGWGGVDCVPFSDAKIVAERVAFGESTSEKAILMRRSKHHPAQCPIILA